MKVHQKELRYTDQAKLEDISAKTNSATKEIKKQLKRISRAEMEDLVARKVDLVLNYHSFLAVNVIIKYTLLCNILCRPI